MRFDLKSKRRSLWVTLAVSVAIHGVVFYVARDWIFGSTQIAERPPIRIQAVIENPKEKPPVKKPRKIEKPKENKPNDKKPQRAIERMPAAPSAPTHSLAKLKPRHTPDVTPAPPPRATAQKQPAVSSAQATAARPVHPHEEMFQAASPISLHSASEAPHVASLPHERAVSAMPLGMINAARSPARRSPVLGMIDSQHTHLEPRQMASLAVETYSTAKAHTESAKMARHTPAYVTPRAPQRLSPVVEANPRPAATASRHAAILKSTAAVTPLRPRTLTDTLAASSFQKQPVVRTNDLDVNAMSATAAAPVQPLSAATIPGQTPVASAPRNDRSMPAATAPVSPRQAAASGKSGRHAASPVPVSRPAAGAVEARTVAQLKAPAGLESAPAKAARFHSTRGSNRRSDTSQAIRSISDTQDPASVSKQAAVGSDRAAPAASATASLRQAAAFNQAEQIPAGPASSSGHTAEAAKPQTAAQLITPDHLKPAPAKAAAPHRLGNSGSGPITANAIRPISESHVLERADNPTPAYSSNGKGGSLTPASAKRIEPSPVNPTAQAGQRPVSIKGSRQTEARIPARKPLKSAALSIDSAKASPLSPEPSESPSANVDTIRKGFLKVVWSKIFEEKYYPQSARDRGYEGMPVVAFTLGKNGDLKDYSIVKSSTHKLLDRAALDAVKSASPFPPIPGPLKQDSIRFNLPISFILEEP